MVGQMELAFRLAVGLFVIVAPTLLFLGLWRGLEAMKDDELIERARAEGGFSSPSPTDIAASMLPDADSEATTCESCGAPNLTDATYCQECIGKLSSP